MIPSLAIGTSVSIDHGKELVLMQYIMIENEDEIDMNQWIQEISSSF